MHSLTGGGKTEAYLGLIALTIINRRKEFKEKGGGTAAIMRYTLRLLTMQQFQRATLVIMALELIRRWGNYELGIEPINIGLWVGKNSIPNSNIDLIYEYFNEFRLLLCCSDGTKHASFVHDFVKLQELETLKYMAEARNRGISVKDIKPQELHLLLSAYYSAIF